MRDGIECDGVYDDSTFEGFAGRGDKVRYLGFNGFDGQRAYIEAKGVKKGHELTVVTCYIGDWSSSYTFEEVDGHHNTVMFELV